MRRADEVSRAGETPLVFLSPLVTSFEQLVKRYMRLLRSLIFYHLRLDRPASFKSRKL